VAANTIGWGTGPIPVKQDLQDTHAVKDESIGNPVYLLRHLGCFGRVTWDVVSRRLLIGGIMCHALPFASAGGLVKALLLTTLVLCIPLFALSYWLFRPRLMVLRNRLALALKITGVLYLTIIVYRLVTSDIRTEQLQTAGLSLAFFGTIWVAAWAITRLVPGKR
jgi:hypothetical protein